MKQVFPASPMLRFGRFRFAMFCLLLAPLLFSTGCFQRILRADFNEYNGTPGGELLNGSIAGIPDGDSIEFCLDSFVVVDEILENKSLRVRGNVEFVPADHEVPDEYRIDWEGFRQFQGNEGTSTISFMDDDEDMAFQLEFDGSTGELQTVSGTEFAPSFNLGSVPHVISVVIDMRGLGSIDFEIEEAGDPPYDQNNLEFLDDEFDGLDRVVFQGTSNATYYMNDLDVYTMTDR